MTHRADQAKEDGRANRTPPERNQQQTHRSASQPANPWRGGRGARQPPQERGQPDGENQAIGKISAREETTREQRRAQDEMQPIRALGGRGGPVLQQAPVPAIRGRRQASPDTKQLRRPTRPAEFIEKTCRPKTHRSEEHTSE